MEKNEILQASRRENRNGDEMYQKAAVRSGDIAAAFAMLLCSLFMLAESIVAGGYSRMDSALGAIITGISGARFLALGILSRRRGWLAIGIFEIAVCVFALVLYCLNLFGGVAAG